MKTATVQTTKVFRVADTKVHGVYEAVDTEDGSRMWLVSASIVALSEVGRAVQRHTAQVRLLDRANAARAGMRIAKDPDKIDAILQDDEDGMRIGEIVAKWRISPKTFYKIKYGTVYDKSTLERRKRPGIKAVPPEKQPLSKLPRTTVIAEFWPYSRSK
jgi:hypothetical protein